MNLRLSLALLGAPVCFSYSAMQHSPTQVNPERPQGDPSRENAACENRVAWREFAAIWQDNPDFDAFLENVASFRRQRDEAEHRD